MTDHCETTRAALAMDHEPRAEDDAVRPLRYDELPRHMLFALIRDDLWALRQSYQEISDGNRALGLHLSVDVLCAAARIPPRVTHIEWMLAQIEARS